MCKKTILYSVLSVCMVLAFAFTAQAQVSIGVSIQPFPDAGSNPCTDQLVTNQVYNVTVYASNSSFSGSPGNQIPVFLEGKVTENDACSAVGCPPGSEIPGAIGFLSCTPLDACISNCQETAPGTGIVTFDVAPGCLLLAAGQQFKPLVSIDKQALIPSLAGTEDCTLPSDFGKYNMAAKCLDNIATQGVDCQVRDPQTGQTGTGSGTSEVYFPPAPCINVTKDCEPDTGCIGTPITFSGTVTNCGDVDLINLNVSDNKGTINGGTCGSILPAGQSCTYSGVYTAPIVIGANTDTVTATGSTTQGAQVIDTDSATCTKTEGTPDVSIVKSCTPPVAADGNITYSIVVTNTSTGECPVALNCRLEDTESSCDITWNGGLPITFDLAAPGASKTVTGTVSLPCPDEQIDCINTATVVCTAPNGTTVTKTDDATCVIPPKPIRVELNKECVSAAAPTDPIAYTISIRNPNADAPCQEPLTCKIVAETSDCDIEWTNLPALNTPFQVAAGQTITYSGLYSVACDHPAITCNNSISIECTDSAAIRKVSASDNASCNIPPCQEEICRTPGFWGTHAGDTEKAPRSQNITQAVINKVGSLTVCGETIDDTAVNSCDSAVEAICVSVKGEGQRQLVRQLTAAALNCVMSSGNADCSGVSIDQLFADCNAVCQGIPHAGLDIGKCIDAIDCFNNGGVYNPDLMEKCQTGTCSNDPTKPCSEDDLSKCGVSNGFMAWIQSISCVPLEGNCHERELCNEEIGLCFQPPGPAGSSRACSTARGNSLYVAEGSCTE